MKIGDIIEYTGNAMTFERVPRLCRVQSKYFRVTSPSHDFDDPDAVSFTVEHMLTSEKYVIGMHDYETFLQEDSNTIMQQLRRGIMQDIDAICSIYPTVKIGLYDEPKERLASRIASRFAKIIK